MGRGSTGLVPEFWMEVLVRPHTSLLGFVPCHALLFFAILSAPLAGASVADQPPDPLAQHYSAAQTFQLAGDLDHAEAEYHQVLALALQRAGDLLSSEKNDSGAAHLLEDAVAAEPAYVDARTDLAPIYYRTGNMDKAAAQAVEAVKQDPHNARALQLLGSIDFAQGNFSAAEEHLHAALGLQNDFD